MNAKTSYCQNFRLLSKLPTNQPEKTKKITVPRQIPDTSGINTGHIWYCQTQQNELVLLALKNTYMGWVEHLWINIYQHDASLLIVRHTYKLKIKWKWNLKRLSWFPLNRNAIYFNDHQVRVSIMSILIFSLGIAILSMWLGCIQ